MQVSSQTNYQAINSYQQPKQDLVTLPVEPKDPAYSSSEIYEASNGNLVSNRQGDVSVTAQGKTNINNAVEDAQTEKTEETQAQKDATRESAVNYVGMQSKKSQVEIYLSVATDNKVSLGDDDTASIIESLRDVQKQNNIVQAYATYNENKEKFPANGLLK